MHDVAIVGGGISGLVATYTLANAGLHPVLIERSPHLGGLMQTCTIDGCLIEEGPDSYLAAKPWAAELIRELGLEQEIIGSNDARRATFVLRGGRLTPLPRGLHLFAPGDLAAVWASPLLNWPAKLRIHQERNYAPGARPERTVADMVRDHYGEEVLEYLAEPLLAGVYGGEPELLSASAATPGLAGWERQYGSLTKAASQIKQRTSGSVFQTFRSGWGSLVSALEARLQGRATILHAAVEAIEHERGGFRLRAGSESFSTRKLILATRAFDAAPLIQSFAPDAASLLRTIPYSSAMTVALGYRSKEIRHPLDGFGFLVPRRERRTVLACTWVGSKFPHRLPPGRAVLRCFAGGKDLLRRSEKEIIAGVRADLRDIMGVDAVPEFAHVNRWPQSMPQYTLGHQQRVADLFAAVARVPGLHITGNAYNGVGIPDSIRIARAAADAVLEEDQASAASRVS